MLHMSGVQGQTLPTLLLRYKGSLFRNLWATSRAFQCNVLTKVKPETREEDEIVISGISGRFPQSNSMEEFKQNLLNKKDMLTEQTQFKVGKKLPPRCGVINNLEKFDADFFGVSDKMTQSMDPSLRILLEVTYEAIVDAGINPTSLRGSKTGVYVGCDGADAKCFWKMKHGSSPYDGYTSLGADLCMQANQVSHLFDLKGSSVTLSSVCSGSLYALDTAVNAMRSGKVDRAIVGATCVHLISHHSDDLNILGALSPTGYCKPFDKDGNGFVRSEAVVSILLENKRHAKRNYAKVRHILTSSDGMKKEGIFCPSGSDQEALYRQVCAEANIDPAKVFCMEAHGTGTTAGDPQELQGLANFYGKAPNRTQPLLVGSVKSNMGHAEAAAGLASIAKFLVSAQEGFIPPTIHFHTPNEQVADLFGSLVQAVTEKTEISNGDLVGVSSFGIGGTNAHAILELNSTPKSIVSKPTDSTPHPQVDQLLPVLVALSGRTERSLKENLGKAMSLASNPEYCSLLHQVFKNKIPGHDFRAFGVIPPNQNYSKADKLSPATFIANVDSHENRPLWLVFSGMGSQWSGMGEELMKVEAFRESVQRSKITLTNAGVDLDALLEPSNQTIFQNIRNAYNSIAVMQVALYDTLMSLGVRPNGFFGHSFGEIMCAYADGVVNAEEALLLVDARGRANLDAKKMYNLEPGAMAAVGLPVSDLKLRCPPEVTLACHNGPKNVTVAGPKRAVADFVRQLEAEGVFVRAVNSCNVASHSPLVQPAVDLYLKYMEDILKGQDQRVRTNRWVSTSIAESELNNPLFQASLPQYIANNLVNPVLFHEAVGHVPSNAVVVEIAPKGLLHGILTSSLPDSCAVVAPMSAKAEDKLFSFFTSLGDMYNAGVDMDLGSLYPATKFPVGAGTPSLNSLVGWKHDTNWIVPVIENSAKYVNGVLNIDMNDISFKYLEGHKLDDRFVFPGTGYLVFAWQTLASTLGIDYQELPVKFENVFFERATFLSQDKPSQLRCVIQGGTGCFEIHENEVTAVRGTITSQSQLTGKRYVDVQWKALESSDKTNGLIIDQADFYKEMGIRGYNFHGEFRSVKIVDIEGQSGKVTWKGNWTTFLDSVLQAGIISDCSSRFACVPVRLQAATINPQELLNHMKSSGTDEVPVLNRSNVHKFLAPGVEFHKMSTGVIQRKGQKGVLCVGEYKFRPYMDTVDPKIASTLPPDTSLENQSLSSLVDIVLENSLQKQVQVYDVVTNGSKWVGPYLSSYLLAQPRHEVHLTTMSTETEIVKIKNNCTDDAAVENADFISKPSASGLIPERGTADLVLVDDLKMLKEIGDGMKGGSYIIVRDAVVPYVNEAGLYEVAHKISTQFNCFLLKKVIPSAGTSIHGISIDSKSNFNWLPGLRSILNRTKDNSRIYLYSQNDPKSGIVGLTKCLAREPNCNHVRCIFDPEGKLTLNFEQPDPILTDIIKKDLLINVYQNDRFGAYRHEKLRSPVLNESTKPVTHAFVNTLSVGDLSSLNWIESPLNLSADPKNLYNVNYASLNFRDLMISTGKLPLTPDDLVTYGNEIGGEFAGIGPDGRRVMVIAGKASFTTACDINSDQAIVTEVPDNWSLEEAATVPVAYATAYCSLLVRAGMKPGQSILIHSGTGGVGQAAINIAQSMNCDIFTTAGTSEKREKLKKLFPFIKNDHIGNSRDCTFENQFLEVTNGKGVDFVLNSLADDKLFASLRCLAVRGTFVEIGKFDMYKDTPLGMNHFLRNVGFMAVDLMPIIWGKLPGKQEVLQCVEEGIKSGVVKPLERTVFKKTQVEEAFRYMAKGNHVGKVLICINEENNTDDWHQTSGSTNSTKAVIRPTTMAVPRSYFHPEKAYVVLGGLGGIGLELADWLITRGAKHVVLLSRSGVTNGYQKLCIKRWTSAGVQVDTNASDLSSLDTATKFMEAYKSRHVEIGGIFNSSLVLRDALIENQTTEMYQAVASPKVTMTHNLDILSRQYYPDMDYFVCFSSMTAGVGTSGMSNYGWANSSMENICKSRNEAGFHGASVQWGIVGDVGYVAEKMGVEKIEGTFLPQRISSCIEALDTILEHSTTSTEHSKCYASYVAYQNSHRGQKSAKAGLPELVARLCFIKNVNDESMQIRTLAELGLDSLSGIELQQRLELEHDLALPVTKIRNLQWQDLKSIADGTFSIASESQTIKGDAEVQDHYANILTFPDQVDEIEGTLMQLKKVVGKDEGTVSGNFFIIPGGDGKASRLVLMANKLKCNVFAFQTRDLGTEQFSSIQKMADAYIQELKVIQPTGPYNLAGYSFGAALSYEIAYQLSSQHNDTVENLILLDGYFNMSKETRLRQLVELMLSTLQYLFKFSDLEKKTYQEILEKTDTDKKLATAQKILSTHLKSPSKELRKTWNTIMTAIILLFEYEPSSGLEANVHFIVAHDSVFQKCDQSPDYYFHELCVNPMSLHYVSGNHTSCLEDPFVQQMADTVNNILGSNNTQQSDP